MRVADNTAGGYRFIPDVRAFSLGVAALEDHHIVRARMRQPVPVDQLATTIKRVLGEHGRPAQALCGVELRSPKPLSPSGFDQFNEHYATVLDTLHITVDAVNPVARTNVVPILRTPATCEIRALSFTVPSADAHGDYLLAGAAERENCPTLDKQADSVLEQLRARISTLGVTDDPTAITVYTAAGVDRSLASQIGKQLGNGDLTVTIAQPPVSGLAFEMDARCISREVVA